MNDFHYLIKKTDCIVVTFTKLIIITPCPLIKVNATATNVLKLHVLSITKFHMWLLLLSPFGFEHYSIITYHQFDLTDSK